MPMHYAHFSAMVVSDGVDCLPNSIPNPYILTINRVNIAGGWIYELWKQKQQFES